MNILFQGRLARLEGISTNQQHIIFLGKLLDDSSVLKGRIQYITRLSSSYTTRGERQVPGVIGPIFLFEMTEVVLRRIYRWRNVYSKGVTKVEQSIRFSAPSSVHILNC